MFGKDINKETNGRDKIIIDKAKQRQNITELFADYDGEYTPTTIDWGEPVGEEM